MKRFLYTLLTGAGTGCYRLALQLTGVTRDPVLFEVPAEPNYEPLKLVLQQLGKANLVHKFLYVGQSSSRVEGAHPPVHYYQHAATRHYLLLDETGRSYLDGNEWDYAPLRERLNLVCMDEV